MTPRLSDDLQQAIAERGGTPLYVLDSANNRYVLVRAEEYEALCSEDREGVDVRGLYPLSEQSFNNGGWDDPEMDAYNDYDAHRPKP